MIALDSQWATPEEGHPRPVDLKREQLRTLVRRSALFVPVNVPRFVEKGWTRGADALILDFEDSVPVPQKKVARQLVRDAMRECARGGADIEVRINKPYAYAVEDLDACIWPGLDSIHFPKAESRSRSRWRLRSESITRCRLPLRVRGWSRSRWAPRTLPRHRSRAVEGRT
jgi:hypothetical protein